MTIKRGMKTKEKHPVSHLPRTLGQKAADTLTKYAGSWSFILVLGIILIIWIGVNITAQIKQWDPYPFILLNLILSCLAAIQAPIILMSQNRSSQLDRLRAEYDYEVNRKAEREIRDLKEEISYLKKLLSKSKGF